KYRHLVHGEGNPRPPRRFRHARKFNPPAVVSAHGSPRDLNPASSAAPRLASAIEPRLNWLKRLKSGPTGMPESLRAIVTPLAGQTTRAIAQALNDRGIPTPRGGHWQSPQVMRLMKPSRSVNRAQRPSSRPLNGLLAFMVLRRLGFRSSAPL